MEAYDSLPPEARAAVASAEVEIDVISMASLALRLPPQALVNVITNAGKAAPLMTEEEKERFKPNQ